MGDSKKLIVVVGPTAVGKTTVAVKLAKHFSCQVLSADSRQFYKEMSIGTAKPDTIEMEGVPHHFIGNLSIHDEYSAGTFETEALEKLEELYNTDNYAILVGGSGLFVDALCFGLDDIPKATEQTRQKLNDELNTLGIEHIQKRVQVIDPNFYKVVDINNSRRLIRALEVYETTGKTLTSYQNTPKAPRGFDCVFIGLDLPRAELYERINLRVDMMLNAGLLDEVASLEIHKALNPLKTVGYQEFYETKEANQELFPGLTPTEIAISLVKRNSRRYAKRQLTWFRRNKKVKWFHPQEMDKIVQVLQND